MRGCSLVDEVQSSKNTWRLEIAAIETKSACADSMPACGGRLCLCSPRLPVCGQFVKLGCSRVEIWSVSAKDVFHEAAEDLVEMGVPREDIVLGLQPPYKRQYTDYGAA